MAALLPLAMAAENDVATVSRVKGSSELRQHLANLGFVDGAEVKVVTRVSGDVIVLVKGARLGLDRSMANHIMVAV